MMSALYIGNSGMQSLSEGLSAISNNISNINTVAYKQQSLVFQDAMSVDAAVGAPQSEISSQVGMGSLIADDRTLWTEGAFELGTNETDLAINGKGYFQVISEEGEFYTRAGNFNTTQEGFIETPSGLLLSGLAIENGIPSTELEIIQINPEGVLAAKSSTNLQAQLSIGASATEGSTDPLNPFFSMIQNWDASATVGAESEAALESDAYQTAVPLEIVGNDGQKHTLTLYLDSAGTVDGQDVYEYMLAADPSEVTAEGEVPQTDSGLLMMGTLTFTSAGELSNMTAFTPTGTSGNNKDLANWTAASLVDGKPSFSVSFAGLEAQHVTLDLGVSSAEGWNNMPANASLVGVDAALLGGLTNAQQSTRNTFINAENSTTALQTTSSDGYLEGMLADMEITEDGIIRVHYSNAQTEDLYAIPLFRFTSEDGLYREGNNLYSATADVGEVEWGLAGTSNYGGILSTQLETSNVDLSTEMVNLIFVQRGFQMNSKTVTVADELLQKAIEIKRT